MEKLKLGDIIRLREGDDFYSVQRVELIKSLCPNVTFTPGWKNSDLSACELTLNEKSKPFFDDLYIVIDAIQYDHCNLNGFKVSCLGLEKGQKISFYQTRGFTCVIADIKPLINALKVALAQVFQ
jgi:hypothetical protein